MRDLCCNYEVILHASVMKSGSKICTGSEDRRRTKTFRLLYRLKFVGQHDRQHALGLIRV